ncbi:class I SAM-dependent methyltransferase [Fluoribacter dumoffii]|uniref:class I SAM-dependent methyltransferase n=1 Tax=Fluoribacter dumoffii TaxID=463 RepID=UPI002243ED02|nr:class I SAM-dependent methyltransferase [Fluoribacter dumoffii]MCW8385216.1 class I SAM-dependent methyltransferase [Fluoribacter dumoffii]MCW8496487.1 class I SAM-dependent methyltransferase [Fluoribacter dumoffii]
MIHISVVGYEHQGVHDKAKALAEQLNFVVDKDAALCLYVTEDRLSLKIPGFSPIFTEFSPAFWSKRKAEGKKQGLVRACKPSAGLKIIDATAGWGRDSAILASFNAEVLMLERNPIMGALLYDGLSRLNETERHQSHLNFQAEDAYSFLKSLDVQNYPDVIYIDPMHPERSKSALVKKDMQALQQIIGPDYDALELIQLAITRVRQRVVVKWPQKTKSLLPANAAIEGKTVRFDIYFPKIKEY